MSVLDKISSALGRKDEVPNQELAAQICKTNDKPAIEELVENLGNKNKAIQNDCIKVLYEIGSGNPELVALYLDQFLVQLHSKNNRMQWGAECHSPYFNIPTR